MSVAIYLYRSCHEVDTRAHQLAVAGAYVARQKLPLPHLFEDRSCSYERPQLKRMFSVLRAAPHTLLLVANAATLFPTPSIALEINTLIVHRRLEVFGADSNRKLVPNPWLNNLFTGLQTHRSDLRTENPGGRPKRLSIDECAALFAKCGKHPAARLAAKFQISESTVRRTCRLGCGG